MKRVFTCVICLFLMGCMLLPMGCSSGEKYNMPVFTNEGEAITPNKSSKLQGKQYTDVVSILENRGFKNIRIEGAKPEYSSDKNFTVKEVSIGGNTRYYPDVIVSSDISVIIRYYIDGYSATVEQPEGTALTPKNKWKGKLYPEVVKIMEGRGFTNVTAQPIEMPWWYSASKDTDKIKEVSIGGNAKFDEWQIVPANTEVIIWYYIRSEKIDPYGAVEMAEGEALTPGSYLSGKNYQDVIKIFQNRGFKNIRTERIENLIFGWLTEDGEVEEVLLGGINISEYESNQTVSADIEVVIRYHTFPSGSGSQTENQSNQDGNGSKSELTTAATNPTPEENLEYVKRAAVTAMTNWCAFDGKTHSYSDTSGDRCLYYMFVTSWGTWEQKGDNNFQVQNLQLRTYGKEDGPTGEYDWDSVAYKFTLDVKYDPSKKVYTISNVYGAYKEKGDTTYTNMKFCASDKLFSVPFSLVEKGR